MPTEEDVLDALGGVIDPGLGLDFMTLGLVCNVEVGEGEVEIIYTLTSPGCRMGPHVAAQMVALVRALAGVRRVKPRLVFSPRWSRERLTEGARFALGL